MALTMCWQPVHHQHAWLDIVFAPAAVDVDWDFRVTHPVLGKSARSLKKL